MTSLSGRVRDLRGRADARRGDPAGGGPEPGGTAPGEAEPGAGGGGLTVSQLAERSGVGVPSIHHYRRLGLLPPPVEVSATRFRYDERHVEALQAIRLLRERRGLSLAAIRDVLPDVLASGDQQAFRPEMWDAVLAIAEVGEDEHDETRARLLEVARAAFGARGYGGVNVEQLCQGSGIAKGSFYRYFASKEAVYVAAARSVVDVVAAAVGRWRRALDPAAAATAVAAVLRPELPLVLEVVVRAAHGDEALADVVPGVVAGIADAVAPRLDLAGGAAPGAAADDRRRDVARQVAESAVDSLFRRAAGLGEAPE